MCLKNRINLSDFYLIFLLSLYRFNFPTDVFAGCCIWSQLLNNLIDMFQRCCYRPEKGNLGNNPSRCLWTRKTLGTRVAVKDTLPHVIKHRLVLLLSFGFRSRLVGFMNRLVHLLEDTLLKDVLVIHGNAETLEFIRCRAGRCCLDTLSVDVQQGSRPLCAYVTDKKNNLQVKMNTLTM